MTHSLVAQEVYLSQAGVLDTVRVLGPFSTYLVVIVRVPVNVFGPVSVLSLI